MTRKGADYAWDRPTVDQLKAAGVTFVVRYLSYNTTGKNLTKAEADSYRAAGIDIVSNWEYAASAALKGYAQGVKDATEAERQHLADGGPAAAPIYFSVDFDAKDYAPGQPEDSAHAKAKLGPIADYIDGLRSVLGDRVGVYGGYYVVKRAGNYGVKWLWQTYAWSGGQWDDRAQIRQIQNGVKIGGHDADFDQAQVDNFGQWSKFPGSVPSAPSKPAQPSIPSYANGSRTLSLKSPQMIGSDVKFVQSKTGTDQDGIFGPKTKAAVESYQSRNGLGVDGIVGPKTWAKLLSVAKPAAGSHSPGSRTIRRGDKGDDVAYVQRFIGEAKCGKADGDFGPKTESGVRWYQGMRGIGVDGIVGPVTWKNILGH